MSGLAIAFLVLSIVLVWGGLAVSLTYLIRHPLPAEEPASPVEPEFGSRPGGAGQHARGGAGQESDRQS